MPKQNIGEAIAREREKKGLSQRQLANAIGISNAELSKIESGERELSGSDHDESPHILRL